MTPSGRFKILVVEDEQVVAMDLEASLETLDYEVAGVASTCADALKLAAETRPHLVLMDINLHGPGDGIAAAHRIRDLWQIPVIFISAFANSETLSKAKAASPYGYITKPFRLKDLETAVASALQSYKEAKSDRVE